MQFINRNLRTLIFTLLVLPVSAYADSWSCSHSNNVREVHIERATSASVPCTVVYRKLTEGVEDQTLWSAENLEGYCEEKAKAFITKLESWGWVCAETIKDEGATEGETDAAPAGGETGTAPTSGETGTAPAGGETDASPAGGEAAATPASGSN